MRVIRCTAHKVFAHVEVQAALVAVPSNDALNLRHYFGTNAVTGQN